MKTCRNLHGHTLTELMIASAIGVMLMGVLFTVSISLQKNFRAAQYHVRAQIQQMRLLDYISLDLRRALTVKMITDSKLQMTIPDYYDTNRQPRTPTFSKGHAIYGSNNPVISYYAREGSIYRNENGAEAELCTEVQDFKINYVDSGQMVTTAVTFLPRFQWSGLSNPTLRDGTASFTSTLLRNKRQTAN